MQLALVNVTSEGISWQSNPQILILVLLVFVSNPFPVNVIFYPPGNPTVGILDYTYDPYTVKVYNSVELQ